MPRYITRSVVAHYMTVLHAWVITDIDVSFLVDRFVIVVIVEETEICFSAANAHTGDIEDRRINTAIGFVYGVIQQWNLRF
ncbi:hypothetical protein D3C80_2093920 [compost metagenome]